MRATPIAFGGCFGWYHAPPPGRALSRAVLLCPPFGAEALHTWRNWRLLAEQLAEAGLPTLRFDYPGTGDSLGEEAPGLIGPWLDAIDAAAALLRRLSGAPDLALCGLRLGALLAAEAARRIQPRPRHLALLAPLASGSHYAHELALRERMQLRDKPRADWTEASGFALHRTDLDRLAGLDLAAALRDAAPETLLVLHASADIPPAAPPGARLTAAPFALYAEFMREAHLAAPPLEAIAATATALAAGAAPHDALPPPPAPASLETAEYRETPIVFGAARDLFGLLCAPRGSPAGRHAVLILNTGSNHHIGDARYAVLLARRLAARGIASFRVDLGGIGDSTRPVDPRLLGGGPDASRLARIRLYRQNHEADIAAALDTLAARGFTRFTLAGICSGAVLAFQAALSDPRIAGLALGNLPSFARVLPAAGAPRPGPAARGRPGAAAPVIPLPQRLARLVIGRAARKRLTAALDRKRLALDRARARLLRPLAALSGKPETTRAERALHAFAAKGGQALLIYTREDTGLIELETGFGPGALRLATLPGMECVILDGADHSFATAALRDQLIDNIARLAERIAQPASRHPGRAAHRASTGRLPQTTTA